MSTVPTMIAGTLGSLSHSQLSAYCPRNVEIGSCSSSLRPSCCLSSKFAATQSRSLNASSVAWSTTARRSTTYTSRRGNIAPLALATSHAAITDVLPSPVGISRDTRLPAQSSIRDNNSSCHGKGDCSGASPKADLNMQRPFLKWY